jgi:hypothetical protein
VRMTCSLYPPIPKVTFLVSKWYFKQRQLAKRHDRIAACRRIAKHWHYGIRVKAKLLVLRSPWDYRHIDNNLSSEMSKTTF